jgi:3-oxoacyl-[acyl-carrier-protein] synthase-3
MPTPVITGTGYYVPDRVLTNEDMKQYYDTSDEWITERSGIKERRWIPWDGSMGSSDLGHEASKMALEDAGIHPDDIEMMVFATLSPDAMFPGAGVFLQRKMGLGNIPCLDIRMQCSGYIYALSIAEMYIKMGKYATILVVGAEVHSTGIDINPEGRTVGVLFGDGGGATVVQAAAEDNARGVISTHLYSQGEGIEKLWNPEPTSNRRPRITEGGKGLYPVMDGRDVFKNATIRMSESIGEALKTAGWTPDEVDLYIPHQANLRIAQAVAKQLNQPMDKFYMNIQRYGNTTAASIPMAMAEAQREGKLKQGDKLVITAFGSGYTWGSAAIVY